MQQIKGIPEDYTLSRWFLPIYEAYSVGNFPRIVNVPQRIKNVLNKANKVAGAQELMTAEGKLPKLNIMQQGRKRAFVSFAGGKDALAVAIKAKEEGYETYLFHIQGINKVVPSEYAASVEVAKRAGFPLITRKINIQGTKDFGEHPLKNLFILCMLIDEGLKHGATAFGLGNVFEEDSEHSIIDDCLSDSYDMIRDFAQAIKHEALPELKLLNYLHDNLQAYHIVWKNTPQVLPYLSTCNIGDFRRPMRRKYIAKKYGASVLPLKGCGGCYKCAMEYNNKVLFGMVRPVQNYQLYGAKLINDFKKTHHKQFRQTQGNRYGGEDKNGVQVLCDILGYYIGELEYEEKIDKWFVRRYYGHRHFKDKDYAEQLCKRFKALYKLR